MELQKRKLCDSICTEEAAGKRPCLVLAAHTLAEYSTTSDKSKAPQTPIFSKFQAKFTSLFVHIPPFRDGLREVGGLSEFDYTRLRLTSHAVADLWKPFPHKRPYPEALDPYFSGLAETKCGDCKQPSTQVSIRPCTSKYKAIFSGCKKFVCGTCVVESQQHYDRYQDPATELYYCKLCSSNKSIRSSLAPCLCGLGQPNTAFHQSCTGWQCSLCRGDQYQLQTMQARSNLQRMEVNGVLEPRSIHTDSSVLHRWILHKPDERVRNYCPGCGWACRSLQGAFATRCGGIPPLPTRMIRQCAVCLGRRP